MNILKVMHWVIISTRSITTDFSRPNYKSHSLEDVLTQSYAHRENDIVGGVPKNEYEFSIKNNTEAKQFAKR